MRDFIYKIINALIAYFYDVWSYICDAPRLIQTKRINYDPIFCKIEEGDVGRLALIVPHPTHILEFSMSHLIEGLLAADYIVVFTAGSDRVAAWAKENFPEIHVVLRQGEGRDFGIWKDLIMALMRRKNLMRKLKRLLITNDSLYFNKHTGQFIKQISASEKHWACLYESFEPCYHAQSFFISFDNFAINTPAFAEYWKRYLPFNNRRHVIKRGEIRLSKALINTLGVPFCLFDSKRLSDRVNSETIKDAGLFFNILRTNSQISLQYEQQIDKIEKLLGIGAVSSIESQVCLDLINETIKSIVIKGCELHNPTHAVGLIANHLFCAPLKRDLAYRGTHMIADILRFASGYSDEEVEFMGNDLRSRALPISVRGFKRILFHTGRV